MNIEKFCEKYNFGVVSNISKLSGGLMHRMFKVETDKGIFCVKVLNPEVMARDTAYDNFIVSECVSNLAKKNNIPVSSALDIDGDYLKELDGFYYMVFDYVEGKTLKDDEITVEHCREIGRILASIHSLDYNEVGLKPEIVKYKRLFDWEGYIENPNFEKMSYRDLYLNNYYRLNSILKRANERFNATNINQTLTHSDMDPKNVMWNGNNPIVIDWECAGVSNPERELLEDALCWSGFLSDKFDEEKFLSVFREYSLYRSINGVDWYDVICGNLVGRIGWLKYNIERSLGIVSDDKEEMILAENEVIKTINEINRYLSLVGRMYELIDSLIVSEDKKEYSDVIETIIAENPFLQGLSYNESKTGFTNKIYLFDDYVVRICIDSNNEERFKTEIEFYKKNSNNSNVPKMFSYDITKEKVQYCYEIVERVNGKTLYEVWPYIDKAEQVKIVESMINILISFQNQGNDEYDFRTYLKNRVKKSKDRCDLDTSIYSEIINLIDEYFGENIFGLIHGDLHFDNFIYDGKTLKLIDFERCMTAPVDYELRIFSIYDTMPWLWAGIDTDMIACEHDYNNVLPLIVEKYRKLDNIPNMEERIEVYAMIELLDNYSHTKEEVVLDTIKRKISKVKNKDRNLNKTLIKK